MKKFYDKLSKYKSYIMLILVGIFLVFVAYQYYAKYFNTLKDPNEVKNIIMSYGSYSMLVYIGLQVLQVVAFFIPGEIIQIAGGYIFGTLWGSVLSIIGITLGSALAYGFSRHYGKPLINMIISKKDIKFFDRILNLGNINIIVLLLYAIPGIPKDALAYICGISNINFKDFIVFSTVGRIPGILVSAYFGAKINGGNRTLLIMIAIISIVLFVVGVFKGEKIIKGFMKKGYARDDE
ncbi:TVP38/TMEM64 family protein [Clostridiaceae bacterium UIB06]|uniref:TVP38/TMEM64 family membrane protein n=1 Tax=Clostridium thailandense TaxID=2794346 RepID=A0A949WT33_9CLOT|nr:TVP38/TMEM64 family protein [Clostridium thailandense]MBV7275736.1 TVP38/TMEM64 family protein [Clostridium thailandense]MCH5136803.1 TVP38/TMEM64 family protein [Clostridiaceae bacterium UIB06]